MVYRQFLLAFGLAIGAPAAVADPGGRVLYQNDFESHEPGSVPEDFLVLQGDFSVEQQDGNRFLRLPGAPLDSYAVMFGPTRVDGWEATADFFSVARGRRYPTFGVGLNGIGGFRLRVSPAKRLVELYKQDRVVTRAPFRWKSGAWTRVKLRILQPTPGTWRISGKAWTAADPEPEDWLVTFEDTVKPFGGRVTVTASPYAGTPIHFDNLLVTATDDEPTRTE